ncbi:MAG: hypothetical protein JWP58_2155 [Hymenobacter sp.]|nr:hypothetical protein [Hymenobacter sp.]
MQPLLLLLSVLLASVLTLLGWRLEANTRRPA